MFGYELIVETWEECLWMNGRLKEYCLEKLFKEDSRTGKRSYYQKRKSIERGSPYDKDARTRWKTHTTKDHTREDHTREVIQGKSYKEGKFIHEGGSYKRVESRKAQTVEQAVNQSRSVRSTDMTSQRMNSCCAAGRPDGGRPAEG